MELLLKSGAIYKLIKEQLINLPAEKAHLEMIPYRSSESLRPKKDALVKSSAVLCLFSLQNNILEITLMERTKDGSPHSGQISFPGGKIEGTDTSLAATALRETHEEIGISADKITVIGQLTPLYIPVSNFQVTPFVGYTDNLNEINLSVKEVKSVFSITIDDLVNPLNKIKKDIPNHLGQTLKNIPCFSINDKIIWGATALILNEVKMIYQKIVRNQT